MFGHSELLLSNTDIGIHVRSPSKRPKSALANRLPELDTCSMVTSCKLRCDIHDMMSLTTSNDLGIFQTRQRAVPTSEDVCLLGG